MKKKNPQDDRKETERELRRRKLQTLGSATKKMERNEIRNREVSSLDRLYQSLCENEEIKSINQPVILGIDGNMKDYRSRIGKTKDFLSLENY